jgi:purine-binding chemotaxis protein CheW
MSETIAAVAGNQAQATGMPVVMGRLATRSAAAAPPKEFLTFRLGAQEYGIDVLKVQEIRGCCGLAGIDGAPECFAGVLDVHGVKVPVADLRVWFELNPAADSMFTVAVILNLDGRVLGLIVDSVSDVVRLARRQIRPAPESWTGPDAQYLIGVGIEDERKLILLDIEKLMSGVDMGQVDAALIG